MWSKEAFFRRASAVAWRYPADNTWFRWGDAAHILYAWNMYNCASHSSLGFLLLGDTKIRSDRELVLNFGLSSAHGVQEQNDLQMIAELLGKRRANASPANPLIPVEGPGSILSDKKWSPLLNDSFILSGIHAQFEFHLAESSFESPGALPEPRGVRFDDQQAHRSRWQQFFLRHPEMLWRGGFPRVFARELIGLMQFGYTPAFTSIGLGFLCQSGAAAQAADFQRYLDALAAVNFHRNDEARVLSRIALFLFGDERALRPSAAAAVGGHPR